MRESQRVSLGGMTVWLKTGDLDPLLCKNDKIRWSDTS